MNFNHLTRYQHQIGKDISGATTVEEALNLSGLNWLVEQRPVYYPVGGELVPLNDNFFNVRTNDDRVLGMVGDRYQICQNSEAFDFVDSLLGDGAIQFTRAGQFRGGRAVWLQAKITGYFNILGDEIDQYILFVNSHDGTGSIKVLITPTRIICSNALNVAIRNSESKWSTVHSGDIQGKLLAAQHSLILANSYLDALTTKAEELNEIKLSTFDVDDILLQLYPDGDTERSIANAVESRQLIRSIYDEKPDLQHMPQSGWRLLNAVSDSLHAEPRRNTNTYDERLFEAISNGHPLLNRTAQLLAA